MISVQEQALGNLVYRTVNVGAGASPALRNTWFSTMFIRSSVSSILTTTSTDRIEYMSRETAVPPVSDLLQVVLEPDEDARSGRAVRRLPHQRVGDLVERRRHGEPDEQADASYAEQ